MTRYLPLIILLLFSGCQENESIVVQVAGITVDVELAATPESRREGLMGRDSLARNRGMLMVFPQAKELALWMLNTHIPLDVGFFDTAGVLLNIVSMEPDGGETIYHSSASALYALEMNRGWFERKGIRPGAHLQLPRVIRGR